MNAQLKHYNIGLWSLFFFFKFILQLKGEIEFSIVYNFSFFAFLIIPLSNIILKVMHVVVSVIFSVLLLHHESFFPPIDRLFNQVYLLAQFKISYLIELLSSFISVDTILIIFTLVIAYYYIHQIIRLTNIVLLGLVYFTFIHFSSSPSQYPKAIALEQNSVISKQKTQVINVDDLSLSQYREYFFQQQSQQKSKLFNVVSEEPNFEVLFLNVCSLSWDDLKYTGNSKHPIFEEFDIVFNHFNSATAYSGPAVIRLLRANCGQPLHESLFDPIADNQCLLFEQLAALGFKNELVLNHNGEFEAFSKHIENNMTDVIQPVNLNYLLPYQYAFDDSPVYKDSDVLTAWLATDNRSAKATLYNTISIHDGNKVIGRENDNRIDTYKRQQKVVLDDLYQFLLKLKKSDRNIVVILIPEHGAGIRGDKMQISGMREIPTTAITNVPVAFKFIGNGFKVPESALIIDAPSSYLSISDLLANVIELGVYDEQPMEPILLPLQDIVKDIHQTAILSENSGTTMMTVNGKEYYSFDSTSWIDYQ